MKGFGSRERYGLIVFLCLVTVLLAVGPVAERSGCTRRYDAAPRGVQPGAGYGSESMNVADTLSHPEASGTVNRKKRRNNGKTAPDDSTRTKRKRKKKSAPNRKPDDPQRRNFLDEPL